MILMWSDVTNELKGKRKNKIYYQSKEPKETREESKQSREEVDWNGEMK